MFINREQLQILTGRKRPSAQVKVLTELNIPFVLNALGQPVVLTSSVKDSISGAKATTPKMYKVNLDWIQSDGNK